jgi:hypothetical protein
MKQDDGERVRMMMPSILVLSSERLICSDSSSCPKTERILCQINSCKDVDVERCWAIEDVLREMRVMKKVSFSLVVLEWKWHKKGRHHFPFSLWTIYSWVNITLCLLFFYVPADLFIFSCVTTSFHSLFIHPSIKDVPVEQLSILYSLRPHKARLETVETLKEKTFVTVSLFTVY